MKIALVSRYYNKHQGIPHDVAELAEQFAEQHEVHVFTQHWQDADDRVIYHRVPGLATDHYLNELFFFLLSGLILRFYQFDVINYHDPCFHPGGIFTCHAFPEAGVRIMEDYCQNNDVGVPPSFFKPFKRLFPVSNYNMAPGRATQVIAVSKFLKSEIKTLLQRESSAIQVLPNGVDLNKFNRTSVALYRAPLRAQHGIDNDDFVVLFVGYYHLRKGLQFLVRALTELEDKRIKVLVVGEDTSAKAMIEHIIDEHGLRNRVVFAGSQKDVHRYFSVGDVLALPSLYEPFGNVVLEAMACGLPPIISAHTGASDIVVHRRSGVFIQDPTNIERLASEIATLSNNPETLKHLSENAQSAAKAYSWGTVADQTLNILKKTVGETANAC